MADSPPLFPPPPSLLSFYSSIYRSISFLACRGPHPSFLPPPPPFLPPILSGLIVLHLFIQSFMAASSSRRPISPPEYGFLLKLSRLFIIGVDPHHISLTLGRWFSHWTTLPTRRVTNPLGSSHKHAKRHSQRSLTTLYHAADLLAAKSLHSVLLLDYFDNLPAYFFKKKIT